MTSAELSTGVTETRAIPRQWVVTGGRIVLAVLLLLAWEWGARAFGPLFFAPPIATAQRIVEMAANGKLFTDVVATMRVSAVGFAIGCICGAGLPFILRPLPRVTAAVEPFIMASQGIPKYALTPWLILWFGIGDAPKVIVVTLFTFYITFITVFAGIVVAVALVLIINAVVNALERRALKWRPTDRDMMV
jgi:NitT/TauT family transport system permease protein